jgi:hypothetical protein
MICLCYHALLAKNMAEVHMAARYWICLVPLPYCKSCKSHDVQLVFCKYGDSNTECDGFGLCRASRTQEFMHCAMPVGRSAQSQPSVMKSYLVFCVVATSDTRRLTPSAKTEAELHRSA